MSSFSDTWGDDESDAIAVLSSACCSVLAKDSVSDDLVTMIKQCNKKSTQSLDVCEKFVTSGIFSALIEVCRIIASPLAGTDMNIFIGISLPVLMQAIAQLLANYTARGFPYTSELWRFMKADNFMGYQHLISACKRVHNRSASVAAVASIYNCVVSFYKQGQLKLVGEFVMCRPLWCQIFLSIDTSNDRTLVGSAGASASDSTTNDPLAEWMHLLISLLTIHGDTFELFRTIAPSVPSAIGASSSWNQLITHEQVVLLNMLLDVYDEFIASDKMFMQHVLPTLVQNCDSNDDVDESVVKSKFFQQHCLLLRHLAVEVIPECYKRMDCCKETYRGICQPKRGSANEVEAHPMHQDEEWLVVTRLCVDVVASGVLIIPTSSTALVRTNELLKLTIHATGHSPRLFELPVIDDTGYTGVSNEVIDKPIYSDHLFAVFRDIMLLLSPPLTSTSASSNTVSSDGLSSTEFRPSAASVSGYNSVNEGLANSINNKIELEASLDNSDASSRDRYPDNSNGTLNKFVADSGSILFANQLIKSISKCLGNMVHKCKMAQDFLRTSDCLMVVLNHCSTNINNPLEREWNLMCVRNATENNLENQEFIRLIKVR